MMHSFRGRMISTLKERLREGALILPEGMNELSVKSLFALECPRRETVRAWRGLGEISRTLFKRWSGPLESDQSKRCSGQTPLQRSSNGTSSESTDRSK